MRFPIQYALTYPNKHAGCLEPLDFMKYSQLSFELPDTNKFPSLDFAHESLRRCGTMPAVMNAANEVAVTAFSNGDIRFTDIWCVIEKTMNKHGVVETPSLDEVITADTWARTCALEFCQK